MPDNETRKTEVKPESRDISQSKYKEIGQRLSF